MPEFVEYLQLLVPSQKKETQSDQSVVTYLMTFQYSLHLIGQFGFLFVHDGVSNLKSIVHLLFVSKLCHAQHMGFKRCSVFCEDPPGIKVTW